MRHTISVVVQNRFGVLTRIAGLFSGRGFNIDTLNVGPTQNDKISRMTIVVVGNDQVLEQIVDVQSASLSIEVTGDESKIGKFLQLMKSFGILELSRTGRIALARR